MRITVKFTRSGGGVGRRYGNGDEVVGGEGKLDPGVSGVLPRKLHLEPGHAQTRDLLLEFVPAQPPAAP